jgi:hypothetical protein
LEERPPVEEVEIRLRDFGEKRRPLERAEAGAKCEIARPAFAHGDA